MVFHYKGNDVFNYAEEQLTKYFVKCVTQSDTYSFYFGTDETFFASWSLNRSQLRYDGFILKRIGKDIIIGGNYERSVLFGVYELLEKQGCVFAIGEGVTEVIPAAKELNFSGEMVSNPDYELRSYVNTTEIPDEKWYNETVDIVDFCAKNKVNTFFLHQNRETRIDGYNYEIVKEIRKRGMIFEFGGHQALYFLPRELFDEKPELFVEVDGKRVKEGNLCATNEEAQKIMCENVKKYLDENSKIDIFHFWFEDTFGGSWCSCEKCRKLTSAQQQDLVISKIVEYIKPYHNTQFDMLLYHETINDIGSIAGAKKDYIGTYAPRERCYAHSIGDKTCENNLFYADRLNDAIRIFGNNTEVFEYYSDIILFSKAKVSFYRVIADDLKWYHNAGLRKICSLAFGKYSNNAYELNDYIFMKKTYDLNADAEAEKEKFISAIAYSDKDFLRYYYFQLEKFTELYLAFCGYKNSFSDIKKQALGEYFGEHLKNIRIAKKIIKHLFEELKKRAVENNTFISKEISYMAVSVLEVEQIELRMTARWKNYIGSGTQEETLAIFEEAKRKLYQIIDLIRQEEERFGVLSFIIIIESLCKDQIWTINETIVQEMNIEADLDRSKI